MIQIDDIIEYNGREYRCWFREDQSGDNFNNFDLYADSIYLHFVNINDENDAICLVYSSIYNSTSYIDYLLKVNAPKRFDSNSI